MARTTATCMCRVPLEEYGLTALHTSDVFDWASRYGVALELDYLGRLSVSVADAYKIQAQTDAEVAEHEAEKARTEARLSAETEKAQQRRQEVHDAALIAAGPIHPHQAQVSAWEAIREAERGLDPLVAARLSSPLIDLDGAFARHAGAALTAMTGQL